MTWVAGVFGNFSGFPLTPPVIGVLDVMELGPGDVLGCPYPPLWHFAVKGGAFAIPSSDADSHNALDGAAVELLEDSRTHAKYFQPLEGEEALPCPFHNCVCVCGPCEVLSDVYANELEALDLLHNSSVNMDGGVLSPLCTIVHGQLIGLTDIEGEVVVLAPHC